MTYRVLIDTRAARELEALPKPVVARLDTVILSLMTNPRPPGTKKLKGKLEEGWRVRVGNYRVLYRIDDEDHEVRIYHIGHRREICR